MTVESELIECIVWLYEECATDLILTLDVEAVISKYCPIGDFETRLVNFGQDQLHTLYNEMKGVIGNAI